MEMRMHTDKALELQLAPAIVVLGYIVLLVALLSQLL
jgi:hypothetical protein